MIDIWGFVFDIEVKFVIFDGGFIKLIFIEYKIVELLMKNVGRVFFIYDIYECVWNELGYNVENIVVVYIRKIREKIEIELKNLRYVKVVWGFGYKMEK